MTSSAKLDYPLIDADEHYYEPDDCFSRHIEPKFRALAIRPVRQPSGLNAWTMGDRPIFYMPVNSTDRVPAPGSLADFFSGKQTIADAENNMICPRDLPELMQRDARYRLLDAQGVQAAIVVPTAGIAVEHDFRDRPGAVCANMRSFNRWLEEDWGYGADRRIFATPMMTLLDVDWAVSEIERVAKLGSRFAFLKVGPVKGFSPADPQFDRFWAAVQSHGIKVIFHVGNEGFLDLYGVHWGEDPKRSLMEYSAFQHFACFSERGITDTMAALVLHNLFGRFPKLEVLSLENGSVWIAPMLKSLDKAVRMCSPSSAWIGGKLSDIPSDIFRQHVFVSPYHEDDIQSLVALIGVDRVLFGSDFPHPEGVAEPRHFADSISSLSYADTRRIMRSNTASLLGIAD
jgi:predicted TIM-barrel fold metal-dependent hydrolase